MLRYVVDCVVRLKPEKVFVVVGYQREDVIEEVLSGLVGCVVQKNQRGTAHAVLSAKEVLAKKKRKDLLIINADLPLLRPQTLRPFVSFHQRHGNALTFLSAELENPTGFGRVLRSGKEVERIIEERDASASERRIKEINAGVYLFRIDDLFQVLPKISNKNKKGEYYLTDAIEIMLKQGKKVGIFKTSHPEEIVGINDRYELAKAVEVLRDRKIKSLTRQGVTVYDPSSAWIDTDVKVGRDTIIYSSVFLEGKTVIGQDCRLYPFVHIADSKVGDRVKILSSTMIEKSTIHDEAQIGPFSRLRPKSIVREGARIGNFVEMKNSIFGKRSKAGHLSYLGDCTVEENVNIGAGTITCNYDGQKKYRTTIRKGAFIGSGTELVAPVEIGKNAYVGAGSTITKDVSPEALAVTRGKQVEKSLWAKKKRKK
jgi:bifunctional UDP-N-acetylglucosamine pyrophosphorylase/glucosamine-1-phosphate N-acetyltransferase